jgi:hypothetical protein
MSTEAQRGLLIAANLNLVGLKFRAITMAGQKAGKGDGWPRQQHHDKSRHRI